MPYSTHRKHWYFIKSILFASNAVKTQALWTLQDRNPSWRMTLLKKKGGHFAISCLWGYPKSLHLMSFLTQKLLFELSLLCRALLRLKMLQVKAGPGEPYGPQVYLVKAHGCTWVFLTASPQNSFSFWWCGTEESSVLSTQRRKDCGVGRQAGRQASKQASIIFVYAFKVSFVEKFERKGWWRFLVCLLEKISSECLCSFLWMWCCWLLVITVTLVFS